MSEYSWPFSLSFLSCSPDVACSPVVALSQPDLALFKPSSQPQLCELDRGTVWVSCAYVRQDKSRLPKVQIYFPALKNLVCIRGLQTHLGRLLKSEKPPIETSVPTWVIVGNSHVISREEEYLRWHASYCQLSLHLKIFLKKKFKCMVLNQKYNIYEAKRFIFALNTFKKSPRKNLTKLKEICNKHMIFMKLTVSLAPEHYYYYYLFYFCI